MMTVALVMAALVLGGCASSAQKKFQSDMEMTIENALKTNEPCNITCGKIKALIAHKRVHD